jgi:hypothetical protein
MSEYQKKYARTDILVLWEYDCSNWKRFCYRFSSLTSLALFAYVTLGIDGINILKLF